MILAGDIGGTKTVLALFEPEGERLRPVRRSTFPSRSSATFEAILDEFLAPTPGGAPATDIETACFGVAGPVIDGQCRTTNLPWNLVETDLARHLRVGRVVLLNDLEAAAYGMLFLGEAELTVLNPGASPPRRGNVAVIAAGTGLGEAFLHWDGGAYHPIASEGGHCDFAPRGPLEDALLVYLRGRCGGHVSYERILSGPGFHHIYSFLLDRGEHRESAAVAEAIAAGDPNAAITQFGLDGSDPVCVATLDLFASIYGAEAGNLALKCVARSVFVGGGIAPRILPVLQRGGFLASFLAKGRFESLMRDVGVSVALNPDAPLLGAARYATRG